MADPAEPSAGPPPWAGLWVPLLFAAAIGGGSGFQHVFQFDPDEGTSLMTGFLRSKGFVLYRDVWMDQPPVMQILLSWLFGLVGPSVTAARLMVLGLTAGLLWSLYRVIARMQGAWAAGFAVVALALSLHFSRLGLSVMRGLPALAFTVFSIHALRRFRETRRTRHLALSAVLFAIALQTKLIVALFLPALLVEVLRIHRERRPEPSRRSGAPVLWTAVVALAWAFIAFPVASIDFSQLLDPHLAAREAARGGFPGARIAWELAVEDWDILLLVVAALVGAKRESRAELLLPAISLAVVAAALVAQYPIHYHYAPLLMLPACWLASAGVRRLVEPESLAILRGRIAGASPRQVAATAFLGLSLVLFVARIPEKLFRMSEEIDAKDDLESHEEAIRLIGRLGGPPVVTDAPIFPFYAGLVSDPRLAVVSGKRIDGGWLGAQDFIDAIERDRPRVVVLQHRLQGRHVRMYEQIYSWLAADYDLRYQRPRIYVRKGADH